MKEFAFNLVIHVGALDVEEAAEIAQALKRLLEQKSSYKFTQPIEVIDLEEL